MKLCTLLTTQKHFVKTKNLAKPFKTVIRDTDNAKKG